MIICAFITTISIKSLCHAYIITSAFSVLYIHRDALMIPVIITYVVNHAALIELGRELAMQAYTRGSSKIETHRGDLFLKIFEKH